VSVQRKHSRTRPNYAHNLQGTRCLLEASLDSGVDKFVLASTAAIYGNLRFFRIQRIPAKPMSPYAQSKLEAEESCIQAQTSFGLDVAVLRISNLRPKVTSGPYAGVIAAFADTW